MQARMAIDPIMTDTKLIINYNKSIDVRVQLIVSHFLYILRSNQRNQGIYIFMVHLN
jgi:hypothetical protein